MQHKRATDGFTLIEILVVIAIIGVIVLLLTLAVATAGGERRLSQEAERFQALLGHACTQAELTGREVGLVFNETGYNFAIWSADTWLPITKEGELRPRQWIEGLHVELMRDGRVLNILHDPSMQPQVVCFSSGELTPFSATFALSAVPTHYQINGHVDGSLQLLRLESQR